MLSRDCDGCPSKQIGGCSKRFRTVRIGEFVYCPNGDKHLVDSASVDGL